MVIRKPQQRMDNAARTVFDQATTDEIDAGPDKAVAGIRLSATTHPTTKCQTQAAAIVGTGKGLGPA